MDVPKQLSVLQKKFTDSSSRSSIMIVAALRRALLVAAASSEGMDVSLVAPLLLTVIVTTHAVASAACVSARTINRHLAASDTPRVAAAVLTDTELDSTVAKQIDKLGSNYWVRMIIGALMAAHPQSTCNRLGTLRCQLVSKCLCSANTHFHFGMGQHGFELHWLSYKPDPH